MDEACVGGAQETSRRAGPGLLRIPLPEPHQAQHVLDQHHEEEHRGDAAEQQPYEVGVALGVARGSSEPANSNIGAL
jgi:hypothetical protein